MFRSALLATALCCTAALLPAQEDPEPLHFSSEVIGSEVPLHFALERDAQQFLHQVAVLSEWEPQAESLRRGELVRAFAETLAWEKSDEPLTLARLQTRRALILARLGAINYAAEYGNLARTRPEVRGELYLARAWMHWHAGAADAADRAAARAASAQPAAPAWALAEWQKFRAAHAEAQRRWSAAQEPADPSSADFLAYAELTLAAGLASYADGLFFRAQNLLQQEQSARPGTPTDRLQRARRGTRDTVRAALGDIATRPGAVRLTAIFAAAAREACAPPATHSDWGIYLGTLATAAEQQPGFDLAAFDLHGDLALAEKQTGVGPEWRTRLKAQLADPRLRYSSRLQQTLARLAAQPGLAALDEPPDAKLPSATAAALPAALALLDSEESVLAALRRALPEAAPRVPREGELQAIAAHLRLRAALEADDFSAARDHLAALRTLGAETRALPLDQFEQRIAAAERAPFLAVYEKLLRYPPGDVPEGQLEAALALSRQLETQLSARHGADYIRRCRLPADDAALVQRILHVRLLVSLSTDHTLSAERRLAELIAWCDARQHPDFPALARARSAVAEMPAAEEPMNAAEQAIWKTLESGGFDRAYPAQIRQMIQAAPERWVLRLLLPLAHWRLAEDDLAATAVDEARGLVPTNRASRELLATLFRNNDVVTVLRDLAARLGQGTPAQRAAATKQLETMINGVFRQLSRLQAEGKKIEFSKLPPTARRLYAFNVAALVQLRLAQARVREALFCFEVLDPLQQREASAWAEAAAEQSKFTHDLPDDDARAAWRRLLASESLNREQLINYSKQLKEVAERGSVTAELSAILLGIRAGDYQGARNNLVKAERAFGRLRAIRAQLDQFRVILDYAAGDVVLLFDESADSIAERRRRLEDQTTNYRDRNFDVLADAYQNNYMTQERRNLEDMCREIDALTAQMQAAAAKERAKFDEQRQRRAERERAAFDQLRRLSAL